MKKKSKPISTKAIQVAPCTVKLGDAFRCRRCKAVMPPVGGAYVAAHWSDELTATCLCGVKYVIQCGHVDECDVGDGQ